MPRLRDRPETIQIANNALSRQQRQRDLEKSPSTRRVAHCDVPIVSRDDIADQRKPQPGTLVERGHPFEGFENDVAIPLGNARARIGDPQRGIRADRDADRRALAPMIYSILDEVQQSTG